MKPITIGIAGGSGSGKTTVSNELLKQFGNDRIAFIQHDSYYHDLSHIPFSERIGVNFDQPTALETDLLTSHIRQLLGGNPVEVPVFDFKALQRSDETRRVAPRPVILIEGILVLVDNKLRDLLDIKVFLDAEPDIRFIRRLLRDTQERGRSMESVVNQYLASVRPMHYQQVEPSKRHADIVGLSSQYILDQILDRITERLTNRTR